MINTLTIKFYYYYLKKKKDVQEMYHPEDIKPTKKKVEEPNFKI